MATPSVATNEAIHWIIDWDGTLTRRDTLDALVKISERTKPDFRVQEKWKRVVEAYLVDYEVTVKNSTPDGPPSDIIAQRRLLKQLEQVEQRSIDRVSASDIFKDLNLNTIGLGARKALEDGQVQLRVGVEDFFRHIQERMDNQKSTCTDILDVLSVNWSQSFIAASLSDKQKALQVTTPRYEGFKEGIRGQYGHTDNDALVDLLPGSELESARSEPLVGSQVPFQVSIYANELEGLDAGLSTGRLCALGEHKIISSQDKLRYLQSLRKLNLFSLRPIPIVYVGDSLTDLECLLAADLGICVRDDPMSSSQRKLAEVLDRIGIKVPHITASTKTDAWGLVWAKDFLEIKHWTRT